MNDENKSRGGLYRGIKMSDRAIDLTVSALSVLLAVFIVIAIVRGGI